MTPPETNPKAARAVADGKAPLQYLEPAANAPTARVLEHGAEKYGYRNWRVDPISLRTYLGAVQRHIDAMKEGQWLDPDSGQPHFAHIGANVHVVMDAKAYGTMHDDTLEVESIKPGVTGRPAKDDDCVAYDDNGMCIGWERM